MGHSLKSSPFTTTPTRKLPSPLLPGGHQLRFCEPEENFYSGTPFLDCFNQKNRESRETGGNYAKQKNSFE